MFVVEGAADGKIDTRRLSRDGKVRIRQLQDIHDHVPSRNRRLVLINKFMVLSAIAIKVNHSLHALLRVANLVVKLLRQTSFTGQRT